MKQVEKLQVQSGRDWVRDADGRIVEYGVVRLPDRVIFDVCATKEEAEERITAHFAWKEERRAEAEANRRELDDPTMMAPTNWPWMDWNKGTSLGPATKDMEWELRRRTVTNWEPLSIEAKA